MSDLTSPAFEALASAFDAAGGDDAQVRIATAFWERIGDSDPVEAALDSVAVARALSSNPSGDLMEQAAENGYGPDEIADAALFAARS